MSASGFENPHHHHPHTKPPPGYSRSVQRSILARWNERPLDPSHPLAPRAKPMSVRMPMRLRSSLSVEERIASFRKPQNGPEWSQDRNRQSGASGVGNENGIFNAERKQRGKRTPLSYAQFNTHLWMQHAGLIDQPETSADDNYASGWGHLNEDDALPMYNALTGHRAFLPFDGGSLFHPTVPYFACSCDSFVEVPPSVVAHPCARNDLRRGFGEVKFPLAHAYDGLVWPHRSRLQDGFVAATQARCSRFIRRHAQEEEREGLSDSLYAAAHNLRDAERFGPYARCTQRTPAHYVAQQQTQMRRSELFIGDFQATESLEWQQNHFPSDLASFYEDQWTLTRGQRVSGAGKTMWNDLIMIRKSNDRIGELPLDDSLNTLVPDGESVTETGRIMITRTYYSRRLARALEQGSLDHYDAVVRGYPPDYKEYPDLPRVKILPLWDVIVFKSSVAPSQLSPDLLRALGADTWIRSTAEQLPREHAAGKRPWLGIATRWWWDYLPTYVSMDDLL